MTPKLVEIPLGPFTSPTGQMNYSCDCDWDYGEPQDDCEHCEGTGRVTGDYTPCQRASSEDEVVSCVQRRTLRCRIFQRTALRMEFQWILRRRNPT